MKDEGVMLCKEFGGHLTRPMLCEPKVNGLRGIIEVGDGSCRVYSRKGKPFWNTEAVQQECVAAGFAGCVLDGEFCASSWNETLSVCRTQSPKDARNLAFFAFDCLTAEEWRTRTCSRRLSERRAWLSRIRGLAHVSTLASVSVATDAQLKEAFDAFVGAGFEGVVLKDPGSFYSWTRSDSWLKFKPHLEADLTIVGANPGTGKCEGMLGALVLAGRIGDAPVATEVGTGFDDGERQSLWAQFLCGELEGRTVEVRYQELLPSGALLFPAFIKMKEDC